MTYALTLVLVLSTVAAFVAFVWVLDPQDPRFEPFIAFILGCAGLIASVVEFRSQRTRDRATREIDRGHSQAVSLRINRDDNEVQVWASNQGTHEIRILQITAIPDNEDWAESSHGRLPEIDAAETQSVSLTYLILGGWFYAEVASLVPDRGVMVVRAHLEEAQFTAMDFDVSWLDHEGFKRKSHGVADLKTCFGEVELSPRSVA